MNALKKFEEVGENGIADTLCRHSKAPIVRIMALSIRIWKTTADFPYLSIAKTHQNSLQSSLQVT